MSANAKIIDDRAPGAKYSGEWKQNGVEQEHEKTTTYTSKKGAVAKITFTGNKISVFGTLGGKKQLEQKHNPESTYKIDNGPETKFTGELKDVAQFKHLFFKSNDLKDGDHILTITNQVDDGFLYIDYYEIQPPIAKTSASSSLSSSSTSTSSSSSSTPLPKLSTSTIIAPAETSTVVVDYTQTADSSLTTSGASTVGAGSTSAATKIAAGLFGGIVGVALLAAVAVIALKKRRDRKREEAVSYFSGHPNPAWHKPGYY